MSEIFVETVIAWIALAFAFAGTATPRVGVGHNRPGVRAAPGVIVFSGGPLREPIVLSDWNENMQFMMSATQLAASPGSELDKRQKLDVLMYWGQNWSRYASTPDSLALLARVHEAQPGAYYPPSGRLPAVFVFGAVALPSSTRLVSRDGLSILVAHHIPVAVRLVPAR